MEEIKRNSIGFGNITKNQETHSCCCGDAHHHHEASGFHQKTVYQCPMKCENDKTYNAPGRCPVCNMHLSAVS